MQNWILVISVMYWLPLIYILKKAKTDTSLTISDYVKSGPERKLYLFTTTVSMTALLVWVNFWLIPLYDISWLGSVFITSAYIGMMLTTAIPRVGQKVAIHDMFAAVSGISIFFLLLMFYMKVDESTAIKYSLLVGLVAMAALGPVLFKKDRNNFLVYQLAYYTVFFVVLVGLSYF